MSRRRREKSASDKLAAELRARMVEALLDAARERRKVSPEEPVGMMLPNTLRPGRLAALKAALKSKRLVRAAVGHALELADQHLTITGETDA